MTNKIPDIKEPIYILQSYIEKLIDSNCEEIPYEGINIDKSTLKSDILELVLNQRKDYATFHVEAALKAASEKATTKNIWEGNTGSEYCDVVVDKNSILNSYPLENIK
jgi:hypothetical protein